MALARRHVLPAIREPPYEVNDVPRAKYNGQGSACQFVDSREDWLAMLGETVLVSNRAEEDFERKLTSQGELVLHPGKPLSLEYLADRIDTDDPLWGYTIRSQKEGWMQGYITLTTFTTWLKWFRFDSLCEAAGVLPYLIEPQPGVAAPATAGAPGAGSGDERVHRWWDDRVVDADGRLARALNRQIRDGDWTDEGVIWPRVAEVSLLAGLGCGGLLLDAALEELYEKRDADGDRQYEYVVVQATENAVPFYESRGFVRVGAIARYEERMTEAAAAKKASAGGEQQDDEDEEGVGGGEEDEGRASYSSKSKRAKTAASTPTSSSSSSRKKKEAASSGKKSPAPPPPTSASKTKKAASSSKKPKQQQQQKRTPSSRRNGNGKNGHEEEEEDDDEDDVFEDEPQHGEEEEAESPPPHQDDNKEGLTGTWSPFVHVKAQQGDTPRKLAKRLRGVRAADIVFLNRRIFGSELLKEDSVLIAGTLLRAPVVSKFDLRQWQQQQQQQENEEQQLSPVAPLRMRAGELKDVCFCSVDTQRAHGKDPAEGGMWYSTQHESIPQLARKFGVSAKELVALNRVRYADLKLDSNLHPGSMLLVPGRAVDLNKVYALSDERLMVVPKGEEEEAAVVVVANVEEMARRKEELRLAQVEIKDAAQRNFYCATTTANSTSVEGVSTKQLSEVMAYRHWTFPDEPASLASPSYMMAMPLSLAYLEQHVPSFKQASNKRALDTLREMSEREYVHPPYDYIDEADKSAAAAEAATAVAAPPAPQNDVMDGGGEDSMPAAASTAAVAVAAASAGADDDEPPPPSPPAVFCASSLNVQLCVKSRVLEKWRVPVGDVAPFGRFASPVKLFVRGGTRTQRVPVELSRSLKPRPPAPPPPPLAAVREYLRQVRPELMRAHPDFTFGDATRVCESTWKLLKEDERAVYTTAAAENRQTYHNQLRQYLDDLPRYHQQWGLDAREYDLSDPAHPILRSLATLAVAAPHLKKLRVTTTTTTASSSSSAAAAAAGGEGGPFVQHMLSVDTAGPGYRKLMNKVVTLSPRTNEEARRKWVLAHGLAYHQPPQAEFYYTLTYIPDLKWCRLVPLKRAGVFQPGGSRKRDYDRHVGRVKWMLAPESEGGEIDVGADRCVPVWKAFATKNVHDADKEEWDVFEMDPKLAPFHQVDGTVEASNGGGGDVLMLGGGSSVAAAASTTTSTVGVVLFGAGSTIHHHHHHADTALFAPPPPPPMLLPADGASAAAGPAFDFERAPPLLLPPLDE